jgi:hypothetical protein
MIPFPDDTDAPYTPAERTTTASRSTWDNLGLPLLQIGAGIFNYLG